MSDMYMSARAKLEDLQSSNQTAQRTSAARVVEFSQKIATLEAENSMYSQSVESSRAQARELEQLSAKMRGELEGGGKEAARMKEELKALKEERDLWVLQKESYAHQIEEGLGETKKARKERDALTAKKDRYKKERDEAARLLKDYKKEAEEEGRKNHELSIELATASQSKERLCEDAVRLKREVEAKTTEAEEGRRALEEGRREYAEVKEKLAKALRLEDELGLAREKNEEQGEELEKGREREAEAQRKLEELRRECDLGEIRSKNLEERLDCARLREEDARAALVSCENRCDMLSEENRKMKGGRDKEGKRVEDIAKMMAEVEGRAAEGVRVREEEILDDCPDGAAGGCEGRRACRGEGG